MTIGMPYPDTLSRQMKDDIDDLLSMSPDNRTTARMRVKLLMLLAAEHDLATSHAPDAGDWELRVERYVRTGVWS